jgi:hypothetical protein
MVGEAVIVEVNRPAGRIVCTKRVTRENKKSGRNIPFEAATIVLYAF